MNHLEGSYLMSPAEMAERLRELSTMVPHGWHKVCEKSAAYIERQTKLLAALEIELVERDKKIIERFLRQSLRDLKK
jgi:hypothetical protein